MCFKYFCEISTPHVKCTTCNIRVEYTSYIVCRMSYVVHCAPYIHIDTYRNIPALHTNACERADILTYHSYKHSLCVCMLVCVCVWLCVCICVFVYMCVCVCVCVINTIKHTYMRTYEHTYINTHIERYTNANSHTCTHTHTYIHTQLRTHKPHTTSA